MDKDKLIVKLEEYVKYLEGLCGINDCETGMRILNANYYKIYRKEIASLKAEIENQSKDFICCKCGKGFDTLDGLAWHKTYKGQCPQKAEVEKEKQTNECIHEFESDGGRCLFCHKTVSDILND